MKFIIICKAASVATPSPISCKVWVRGTTHYSLQEEKPPKQVCKAWFHQTQANNVKHQKSSANLQMCCKRTWKVCSKSSKKRKTWEKAVEDMSMCLPWLWATLVVPGPRFSRPNSSRVFVSRWPRAGHFHMVRTCRRTWCCDVVLHLKTSKWFSMSNTTLTGRVWKKLHPCMCAHDTCTAAAMAFQKTGYGGQE